MKYLKCFSLLIICVIITSCGSTKLVTHSVAYQSVRTRHAQPTKDRPIPNSAKIAVAYTISEKGGLTAVVYNRTSDIMIIDQTKSFFVNSDGKSVSYYDPTVRTTSKTDLSSSTSGASVNLGAVAGAFGIGGTLGTLASGVNVGGSGTSGQSITNTTYIADQPQVSLAPNSNGAMSKVFAVRGLGINSIASQNVSIPNVHEDGSYCKFSVCISYSLDNGETFEKLVTNFYANSKIVSPVTQHGKVNDALRNIYITKSDALYEPWHMIYFNDTYDLYNKDKYRVQGILFDYQ